MEVNCWLEGDDDEGDAPAEITLLEFNLRDGPTRAQHWLLHHGQIKLGTRNEMMQKAAREHKIEVDLDDTNSLALETDYHKVVGVSEH